MFISLLERVSIPLLHTQPSFSRRPRRSFLYSASFPTLLPPPTAIAARPRLVLQLPQVIFLELPKAFAEAEADGALHRICCHGRISKSVNINWRQGKRRRP